MQAWASAKIFPG